MEKVEFLKMRLNSLVEEAATAKAKLIENAEKMGVAYAMQWGDRQLKAEMLGRAATEALQVLEMAGEDGAQPDPLKVLKDWATERCMTRTLYICHDSSKVVEQVLEAQAYARIAEYVW